MTFPREQLTARRKSLHLTMTECAKRAKIPVDTWSRIERGYNDPSVRILSKMLEVLGGEMAFEWDNGGVI